MSAFARHRWLSLGVFAAAWGLAGPVSAQRPAVVNGIRALQLPQAVRYEGSMQGALFEITDNPHGLTAVGPANMQTRTLGFTRKTGLRVAVELNWPGQYGYRPLKVTITARRPASRDRTIRFTFHAGSWYSRGRSIIVERAMTLPAGGTTANMTLLAPQYVDWNFYGWELSVDGQDDEQLTIDVNPSQQGATGNLAVIATPPAGTDLEIPAALQGPSGTQVSLRSLPAKDMPTNWLGYSSLDLVVMPASHLADMAAAQPKQTAALLRWVRAGGNLWLVNTNHGDGLERAERVLEGPPAADSRGKTGGPWKAAPLGERALDPAEQALFLSDFDTGEAAAATTNLRQMVNSLIKPTKTSERWFRVRAHGLGVVAAFAGRIEAPVEADSPTETSGGLAGAMRGEAYGGIMGDSATPYDATLAMSNSLLGARFHAASRHGNMSGASNAEFNNLLIPNVGVAPVTQFQLLLTLFALAIGPANYWWFKRRQKLPLLLVTTPLAALAMTTALVSYGVLADGTGARVRARSLTLLDQRVGEAACWARLSYYAGVAPRKGLSAPADVAVFPILPDWSDDYGYGRRAVALQQRTMRWDDRQRLTRGWLASRTPTQFLTITARPTKKRLELRATDGGLRVTNALGVRVVQATVRDHEGQEYYLENLADGERVLVRPVSRQTISTKMRKAFSDNFPEFPSGAEPPRGTTNYGLWLSKNLMEGRLEAINSPTVLNWGDGSYIAITDRGVELDLGVEEATEESSFHVVEGKW